METIRIDKVSFNLDWVATFKSKEKFMKHPANDGVASQTLELLWDKTHPVKNETTKEETNTNN